jgi:hypothetical protein
VSPFLVTLTCADTNFYWVNNLLNKHSLIWFCSLSEFDEVYNHFRKFLIVETEDLEKLYFRFYDPRVLRIFLPTCSSSQLDEFFGPVDRFICEDEDPAFALVFSLRKGLLITERKPLKWLFPEWVNAVNQTDLPDSADSNQETPKPVEDLKEDKEEKRPARRFIY